jgi:hypothetical protein
MLQVKSLSLKTTPELSLTTAQAAEPLDHKGRKENQVPLVPLVPPAHKVPREIRVFRVFKGFRV